MNNKLTIWQKINKSFNSGGNIRTNDPIDDYQQNSQPQTLTANSLDEFNQNVLELQQQNYLNKQYDAVRQNINKDSLYYETTRLSSYMDAEAMEYFPEIATALDVFSIESTPLNEEGKILQVYSESDRVKNILEDLFYKRLNINTTLPSIARNMVKLGDNFLYLKTDAKLGVVKAMQLKNIEITREEVDQFDDLNGAVKNSQTVFKWSAKNLEFNNFQIAHFRLTGDDRKLPYGTSVVEKARKIFKQLTLLEDAVLIYRITRAPERRVFNIDVGNINDADVDARVAEVAQKFKKTTLINSSNGQLDYRQASISVDTDYFLAKRGDASTTIETLPGASNLGEISDLTFFQNKLFAALRVPKSFLNFEEAAGDGKNLALQDIRFLKTVNKVQQALIQELNKIAIIHLLILGFDEELDNFKLTLGTPSIQADILRTEQIGTKLDVYVKAVTDAGNGFAPMSMTRAKKEILGMTDDEIILDLQQQRIEKVAAIENNNELLKTLYIKSGIFDSIDKRFASTKQLAPQQDLPEEGGGGGGGGFGGSPDLGGGDELAGDLPPEMDGGGMGDAGAVGGGDLPTPDAPEPAPETEPADAELELTETKKFLIGESNTIEINNKTKSLLKNIDRLTK